MAITFAVDDVVPAPEPAATVPLAEWIGAHLHLGLDGALPVLPGRGVHPLLAAVHHAFAEHRPLVLSPDAVWLTIAQGVAHHVRLNAERLRSRLVRHDGRKLLAVQVLAEPACAEDWAMVVDGFRALIADDVGAGVARLLTCDFSTTGVAERVASEIVLMDAVSTYYDYVVNCVCGIPAITLTGTVADWRAIRARLDVVAELELGWWTAALVPIADQLIAAAEGRPDAEFFRAIYKPEEAYGEELITGWIARLYPYIGDAGDYSVRNPLLALPLDAELPASDAIWYDGPGIKSDGPAAGPSQVLVRLTSDGAPDRLVVLEGGLLAVEQDVDGRLVPRAGFVVRAGAGCVAALVERLRAEHAVVDGTGDGLDRWASWGEVRALFAAIDEATLFAGPGAWHLRPLAARDRVELARRPFGAVRLDRVIDLPDGSFLGLVEVDDGLRVVRLDGAALRERPAEPPGDVLDPVTGLTITAEELAARARLVDARTPARWVTTQRLETIPVVGDSLLAVLMGALQTAGALELPASGTVLDAMPSLLDGTEHAAPLVARLRRDHHVVESDDGRAWRALGAVVEGWLDVGGRRWTIPRDPQPHRIVVPITVDDWVRAVRCVDLPDGTMLARCVGPRGAVIVRLVAAAIAIESLANHGRRTADTRRTLSTEDAEGIPVLGRSLVEILTHALDTGALPAPVGSLAAWWREQRDE